MKRKIIIGLALLSMATLNACTYTEKKEELVKETEVNPNGQIAVLVDIDENGNYILQTEDGNLWAIQDGEEIYFSIEIDNNGTEDVTDDIITSVEME